MESSRAELASEHDPVRLAAITYLMFRFGGGGGVEQILVHLLSTIGRSLTCRRPLFEARNADKILASVGASAAADGITRFV